MCLLYLNRIYSLIWIDLLSTYCLDVSVVDDGFCDEVVWGWDGF